MNQNQATRHHAGCAISEKLEIATAAVRDEVGSQLCCWMDFGNERKCWIDAGHYRCVCQDVAEAVLEAVDNAR